MRSKKRRKSESFRITIDDWRLKRRTCTWACPSQGSGLCVCLPECLLAESSSQCVPNLEKCQLNEGLNESHANAPATGRRLESGNYSARRGVSGTQTRMHVPKKNGCACSRDTLHVHESKYARSSRALVCSLFVFALVFAHVNLVTSNKQDHFCSFKWLIFG